MNRSPVFIGPFYTASPFQGIVKPWRTCDFCGRDRSHVTHEPHTSLASLARRLLLSSREKRIPSMVMKRKELTVVKKQGPDSRERRTERRLQLLAVGAKKKDLVEERREDTGLLPARAKEIWDSMGVIPWFTLFLFGTLAIKLVREALGLKENEKKGPKASVAASTTEEQQQRLHVFKCGGCGYVIYPARGREFKFFPESFKCPLCQAPKSEFWDLNDPEDPRNWEQDEAEQDEAEQDEAEEDETTETTDQGNSGTQGAETESPVIALAAKDERGILEDESPSDIQHADEDGATDLSRPTEEATKEINDVENETSA